MAEGGQSDGGDGAVSGKELLAAEDIGAVVEVGELADAEGLDAGQVAEGLTTEAGVVLLAGIGADRDEERGMVGEPAGAGSMVVAALADRPGGGADQGVVEPLAAEAVACPAVVRAVRVEVPVGVQESRTGSSRA